jgi:hypothetical protein
VDCASASSQGPIQHSMDDIPSWCNCNALPSSMPAPALLIRAVSDALDVSNASYAESERCRQQDWQAAVTPTATASHPSVSPPSGETSWSVVPEEEWFETPTSRRPAVGYRLL